MGITPPAAARLDMSLALPPADAAGA